LLSAISSRLSIALAGLTLLSLLLSFRSPSRNLIRVSPQQIPGQARDEVFSVLLSVPTERKNQERARCTLRVRQNHDSSHFAAGLASLKQVLAMPSAPCSIIGFYTFPSRYRNVIRSKDEDYPSLLSAISSRLGIVGYCLPPSHLGYSSILDSTRFGVGSSKLDSALAAPLIPATEPESHPWLFGADCGSSLQ